MELEVGKFEGYKTSKFGDLVCRDYFKTPKIDEPFDAVKMSKSLEQVIEKNANAIFKKHLKTLIKEENDYIVYAVWGAKSDGALTDEQKEETKKQWNNMSQEKKEQAIEQMEKYM